MCMTHVMAQKQLNFGLTKPQPAETLPKGKAPFQIAIAKPRSGKAGEATALGYSKYSLTTGWELTDDASNIIGMPQVFSEAINSKGWYDAVVPGTILTSLVAAGKYPDPYFGLNNLAITDSLCRKDWWYRTTFESPRTEQGKIAWLYFNGINYKSRVWLNGQFLGDIKGAFTRGVFNVTDVLRKGGRNVLLVQVLPPHNPGFPDEQSAKSGMGKNGGVHTMDGPTFFATEGWDWIPGIRDRNMGIWQDVQLHYTGSITAADPQVITDLPLPDTTSAIVELRTTLTNHGSTTQQAAVQFSFDGGVQVTKQVSIASGQQLPVALTAAEFAQLVVKNPRLWWPNGYGLPNLYKATLTITDASGATDTKTFRFGIREFSYEMMADTEDKKGIRFAYSPTDIRSEKPLFDYTKRRAFKDKIFIPTLQPNFPMGKIEVLPDNDDPFLVIKVNGVSVFCKGGNWGLDDAMKKVSRENLEPAFKLHRNAHFNMIRNWTGENTEPAFFDLADEYGMLVWNDFWLSTEGFNLNPADDQLFLNNSLDMIRRYRNHPSIAVWCPRNEGYAPVGIENDLATQVAVEDGTRHYNGNSREINLRPSGPWHFFVNNEDYFTKHGEGFSTEIGTFSVPEASSIRKFIAPQDEWPINDVWHYHDLHINNQNLEGYLRAADSLYGASNNLDDFNRKVQLINYDSHRAMFEAWNNKLWNKSSGVLLWMTHPAWPSMIWQTYSWDFQTHGSFFGSKKACEPLHIQMNLHNKQVLIANTSLQSLRSATATMEVYGLDGKLLQTKTVPVQAPANSKTDLFTATLDDAILPSNYLVRLWVKDMKGSLLATNEYWRANAATGHFKAFNQLPRVAMTGTAVRLPNGQIRIDVENRSKQPAIGVKLDALDKADQIILPAYFTDGYFTLLAGEKRTILLDCNDQQLVQSISIIGYNLSGKIGIKK